MKYSKIAFTFTLAALLVSAASCSRSSGEQISEAPICDGYGATPTRTDDCDYIQGYYYDPVSQALIYRAVAGGDTTIIRNNYILPSDTDYSPGQSVILPNPVRSNAHIAAPSQTTPTNAQPDAPIRSNQNFAAPKPATPSTTKPSAPASRGTSFSSPGKGGG